CITRGPPGSSTRAATAWRSSNRRANRVGSGHPRDPAVPGAGAGASSPGRGARRATADVVGFASGRRLDRAPRQHAAGSAPGRSCARGGRDAAELGGPGVRAALGPAVPGLRRPGGRPRAVLRVALPGRREGPALGREDGLDAPRAPRWTPDAL